MLGSTGTMLYLLIQRKVIDANKWSQKYFMYNRDNKNILNYITIKIIQNKMQSKDM